MNKLKITIRKTRATPRGEVKPSVRNAFGLKGEVVETICGTQESLRKGIARMTRIVGQIGGAIVVRTAQGGITLEVSPLCAAVGQKLSTALDDMVSAQQATGVTPGVLLVLLDQRGAYYRIYRCAVDADGRITYAQVRLAGLVRKQEDRIDQEVARLLGVLPLAERRRLASDYDEIKGERARLAKARVAQTQKTRSTGASRQATLEDYAAQGNLLQTVVDLQEGQPVDEATILEAAATAAKVSQPAAPLPRRRTKR